MSTENPDLGQVINDSAAAPKNVTTDAGSATAHSLPDQIAADRYLRSRAVSRNPFAAVCRARVVFGRADGSPATPDGSLPPYPPNTVQRY